MAHPGFIIAFFGIVIPEGWALCDGLNGTPDLRDRFIIGDTVAGAGSAGGTLSATASETHASQGGHTHDTHASAVNTSNLGATKRLNNPDTHANQGAHTHDAHAVRKHFKLAYIMKL